MSLYEVKGTELDVSFIFTQNANGRRENKWKKEKEEFEDTKGVIKIHISKKNRQHNDQKKKCKRQPTIYNTYI
jgi:hypothetical protein